MASSVAPLSNLNWFDFNDASPQFLFPSAPERKVGVEDLKQRLCDRLPEALRYLFPAGKKMGHEFVIGNVQGDPGESLKVELRDPKKGVWHDFATGEGGDILSLWGAVQCLDPRHQFPEIISSIQDWLGMSQPSLSDHSVLSTSGAGETLGVPTGKWDYQGADGTLLACVYRYDTPTGKYFRPWDVKTRTYKTPHPRPLYNQPGMALSDTVIVVEGEKCAQALMDLGFCATTAMNGAKAPLDKTDWSPLVGKHVILWPDHDEPGQKYSEHLVKKLKTLSIASLSLVTIPDDKSVSWDAADAKEEGLDMDAFLESHTQEVSLTEPERTPKTLPAFTVGHLLDDATPPPEDWIAPRILTPGGLLVFGGAPKVGKTDLMLSWLAHLAAGLPFLGMTPPRPLKIFYLQTEIMYPYLRERLQNLAFDPNFLPLVRKNLVMTPQIRMLLNEEGVTTVYNTVTQFFEPHELDILVVDPLRNVYDAGKSGSENDNMAMLAFLQDRIETLRAMLNPEAGIMLTHHTKKVTKSLVEEDPFQALSGAASLRSFYTTGLLLFRPDEHHSVRHLIFELRNGESIPPKFVDKIGGQWQEMQTNSQRLVRKDYGEKLDAERNRRHDVIVQLIFDEAKKGNLYTPTQFRQAFEGRAGLGGERTVQNRLNVLATKGFIKFNKEEAIARGIKSKCGVMCVEGMELPAPGERTDDETGEILPCTRRVLPTHFKESQSGAILPVENPEVWVYLE